MKTDPTILFLDDHLVAIHKPAGLMVHRSALARPSRLALQWVRDYLGQQVFPLHRLDRATSGVLLFARDQQTASAFSHALREHQVKKTYRAIVRGFIAEQGTLDYALKDEDDSDAKPALTHYRRLAKLTLPTPVSRYPEARYSLVQLEPQHGRRHQLRKHMAHLRHPIVGDTVHGDGKHNRLFREHLALHRMLLAATQLEFLHPHTNQAVCIEWQAEAIFAVDELKRRFETSDLEPVYALD